jgi:hypothetical protein
MDNRLFVWLALASLLVCAGPLCWAPSALAQDAATAAPSLVYETPQEQQAQPQPTRNDVAQGQWISTAQGWIWVPAGTTTYVANDVPYAYFYMPTYGWGWYASPWGYGPYAYGPWVGRAWPFGFRVYRPGPRGFAWFGGHGWGSHGSHGWSHGSHGGWGHGGWGHGGHGGWGHGGHGGHFGGGHHGGHR